MVGRMVGEHSRAGRKKGEVEQSGLNLGLILAHSGDTWLFSQIILVQTDTAQY